jgi:succinyl-diaminopimelate desuccinylase
VTDVIGLARSLIRLDTSGSNESFAAELLAETLRACGMSVELDTLDAGRASLIARSPGCGPAPITLTGHLDTVPFRAEDWDCDPLGAEIADGRLYGRGASDMKSGVAALVVAVERHLARVGSGGPGVLLVLTAAEESGCEGARHLLRGRSLPSGGPLLVAEPTGNRLVSGHKGALWLDVTSQGRAAHGSRPDLGVNAITPLARLAVALADEGLPGEHAVMGPVTVNVGTITGGTRVNLVPDHASMSVDVRTVLGCSSTMLLARLKALAGDAARVRVTLDVPAVYSSPDTAFALLVAQATRDVTGEAACAAPPVTYFTDAAVLSEAMGGADTVILGPGDPEQAHIVDESCSIDRVHQAVEIYETVLDRWSARGMAC